MEEKGTGGVGKTGGREKERGKGNEGI